MENDHIIKGVIHELKYEEVTGKKDPNAKYPKYILTLEVGSQYSYKKGDKENYGKRATFPQLEAFNQDLSMFAIGDFVEVHFALTGNKFTRKDGSEGIITKASISYVKYADLDNKGNSKSHKKTEVPSMTPVSAIQENDLVFDEGSDLPF